MNWKGASRGGLWGHRFFFFIIRTFGLAPAYFFLVFVAGYYFLFARTTPCLFFYYRRIHGYAGAKARWRCYVNYFRFGQVLIDRVAVLSGARKDFVLARTGGENLDKVSAMGKGGILLSAHVGNWELASQILNRLPTRFNILMYDLEHEKIKAFMDRIQVRRHVSVIPIRNDFSHLGRIRQAFDRNELLVMHGDRFITGVKTMEKEFLGRKARFPLGPFHLAVKSGVPVSMVFAFRKKMHAYHLYATKPEIYGDPDGDPAPGIQALMNDYVSMLEKMVRTYPDQWFNYYRFWT
jgi:predicted LPLAT superfamily acyltransferase